MKKALSLILSAAISCSFICTAVTASAAETEKPVYEEKTVEAFDAPGSSNTVSFECLFRSDLPEIPFVSAEDYLGILYNLDKAPSGNGSVFTFENGGYTMTIDAEKDVVTFDLYDGFVWNNMKNGAFMEDYEFVEGGYPFEYEGEVKGTELDLSKYGIDAVEKDGSVYLPFCTLNDIFSEAGCVLLYKKDKLTPSNVNDLMGSKGSMPQTRSKAYAEFTYNDFCFNTDYFHGKPSNALITGDIAENGLDKTLDTYDSVTPRIKELLLSESAEDYCSGLMLLQYYVADGGHTHLEYSLSTRLQNYGITTIAKAARKVFGDEINDDVAAIIATEKTDAEIQEISKALNAERFKAYNGFEHIKDWFGASLYRSGDTFFFEFDFFADGLQQGFKEALDIASEMGAKNFVIDVTSNGGGDPVIAAYMVSLMSDTLSVSQQRVVSGNKLVFTKRIDKNLDGKFDEKDDELKYDMRFAILGCKGSYSCPNELACIAQDNGICIIGETTGGGSCCVTTRTLPGGICYNVSGYAMYLRDGGKDADKGAAPDVPLPGAQENYNGFYDVNKINRGIAEFYGDPIPQSTVLCGDLDGDEQITSSDALIALRISAGLEEETDELKAAADADGDGSVDSSDALAILRFSAGIGQSGRINTHL